MSDRTWSFGRRCPAPVFGLLVPALLLGGCRSAFVRARVLNQTGGKLRLLEVDYPSASFGTEDLGSGAVYSYQFKALGSGPTRVSWTDTAEKEHTSTGPDLQEGDEGQITVVLGPNGVAWQPSLHRAH